MKINTKIFDFCIFDDDNDDLLNTHDPCTMYEIDDNKNNPLNDEEYDHEDDTANSKYYSLINILKQKHVKKMLKKLLSNKEYDFNFGNNKKYHYIVVTKPNALLAKS